MGTSKTEVNLRRLIAVVPKQQNQAKLVHYVATLREQLEQLAEERTAEGLPKVSKDVVSDYSEKIEAIASKLSSMMPDLEVPPESLESISIKGNFSGLRRRSVPASNFEAKAEANDSNSSSNSSTPVKLDAMAQTHRKTQLQEDLTDEMVGLARQLKESSFFVSQSVQNSEKILDSTEEAIECSLASTGHATSRALEIYSKSSATSCLTWLMMFVMMCMFVMVVLLIRVT